MQYKAKLDAIIHISLLVAIQWISIGVIVLNALALYFAGSNLDGLIAPQQSPQNYLLIILGGVSLLGGSLVLGVHLHVFLRLVDGRPFAPSRFILVTELTMAAVLLILWASGTSIVTTSFHVLSSCKALDQTTPSSLSQSCSLVGNAIILAFIAVGVWLMIIVASLSTLIRCSLSTATVFTVECSPHTAKRLASVDEIIPDFQPYRPATHGFNADGLPPYPSNIDTTTMNNLATETRSRNAPIEKDRGNSRPSQSWCSYEPSLISHEEMNRSKNSFEAVVLDDLPKIPVGMSQMDLSFATFHA